MKYQGLEEKQVMQKLLRGILNRAAADMLTGTCKRDKLEAIAFVKSEYCELICSVAQKEYNILLKIANKEPSEVIERLKDFNMKSRSFEK